MLFISSLDSLLTSFNKKKSQNVDKKSGNLSNLNKIFYSFIKFL